MTHQIKYTGPTQHTRIISTADAKKAGFVLAEDLQWSLDNRHAVLVDDLDETALEFFKGDSDFKVREVGSDDEPPKLTAKELADKEAAGAAAGGASGSGSTTSTGGGRGTTSRTTAST